MQLKSALAYRKLLTYNPLTDIETLVTIKPSTTFNELWQEEKS